MRIKVAGMAVGVPGLGMALGACGGGAPAASSAPATQAASQSPAAPTTVAPAVAAQTAIKRANVCQDTSLFAADTVKVSMTHQPDSQFTRPGTTSRAPSRR